MRSQETFGQTLQNIQTSLWCLMSSALLGYLIIIQITQAIRPLKGQALYKKKFWKYFAIINLANIVQVVLLFPGFLELEKIFSNETLNPSNLNFEIIFLACSYALIPFIELIIVQDREIQATYLVLPILIMILISIVNTIFNLMIYGLGQTFFVFFRHLCYFGIPAILSQINIYNFVDE
ncbi:transmembrane protein, putative (macronuclear) [Tetrahymena thermophila SB210]|uniref:Transmembrane protein, putative n=1 Tax=Tetrahymena thermophila (strain SB210) TaxID=312017 RepID=X1W3R8_TETTS|nr:transmembrane protein, putative [Tetrahymena thermophila SB210]EDK31400.1 transmembrane protein, putative [Tetrahymena thermophila SB210]|eukprot:XP_001470646.1 transmembrane protein, putative [Tetrahymena thermophila SB210]